MKLRSKDSKIFLDCPYERRDIPASLKGRWNRRYKSWMFEPSIVVYNQILETVKDEGIDIEVCPKVSEYFANKNRAIKNFKLNKEFKTKQFKHQEHITALIVKRQKCFIFAGVGTGKSKAAIDAATLLWDMGRVKKVLIVSPASIMWNFANEIKVHSDFDSTIIYGSITKRKDLISNSTTLFDIVNYEVLGKLSQDILKKGYDMVVFDEVHYCKSRTSNRSKDAYNATQGINIKVGLTGTIISNNYEDLFMPYKVVDQSIFGPHFTRFKERYIITEPMFNQVIGYKKQNELKRLVASNSIKFDIRDVIDNLPDEQVIIKDIVLSNKSKKLYSQMKDEMIVGVDSGQVVAQNVLERLLRLSQITSGYLVDKDSDTVEYVGTEKLDVLKETLSQITDKVLIFCRFTRSIDRVAELCEKMNLGYHIYDGRTKDKEVYLKFNNDDSRVFIAQIQKSEGYSLPNARYCIFYELDYSRKNHIQSKGRILRATGSKHDCIFYIYLLAKNTVDKAIYGSLKKKDFTSREALAFVKGAE